MEVWRIQYLAYIFIFKKKIYPFSAAGNRSVLVLEVLPVIVIAKNTEM